MTSLAASGPGSLRAALETPGPRLVVFEIAGVIDLGGKTLVVRHPGLTLVGQSAPDPGITLIRGGLIVETHDVLIQHIAVRPGDDGPAPWAPDALGARRGKDGPVFNVVFDHCSATWAVDENLSVSGPADVDPANDADVTAHDVTLRHCLIAEALSRSTHPKGEHSKGTLLHDGVRGVTITGCLFAHNRERNPRLKGNSSATIEGNVIYNWGSAAIGIGARGNDAMLAPAEATIAGNIAIAGPDSRARVLVKSVDPGGRVTLRDNVVVDATGAPLPATDVGVVIVASTTTGVDPWQTYERVLLTAGSRPARRDPIDARIIESVRTRSGRIINSQRDVGGYPSHPVVRRALVVPESAHERETWLAAMAREVEN